MKKYLYDLASITPNVIPLTEITVRASVEDIHKAECGCPSQCLGAVAINREAELHGKGHIAFEANEVRFTKDGYRYVFQPDRNALEMLRDLDELGERYGQAEARRRMDARGFTMKFLSAAKIPAKASAERKAQINVARNRRAAQRRALGLPPVAPSKRYTGVLLTKRAKKVKV